jgi:TolB protein
MIAFVASRQSIGELHISVLSADGSLRELQSHSSQSFGPTWLPDGTKLAVGSPAPPSYARDIYIMGSDGSNPINLTKNPEQDEMYPAFSPNGSQICFSSDSGIYVMNSDGSYPTPLADDHIGGPCDWSPEETKIAFTYQVGGTEEIFVINADGSGQTNLTRTNDNWESDPDYSPDGKRIAFESGRGDDFDIYTMDPDGSDVAQVTYSGARDMDPDWQPLAGPMEAKPERQQEQGQQNQQQQPQQDSQDRSVTVHPPDTGGPSLLLVASALLFSLGCLLYAMVRPKM